MLNQSDLPPSIRYALAHLLRAGQASGRSFLRRSFFGRRRFGQSGGGNAPNNAVPSRNSICPPLRRFERDLKAMPRQRVLSAGQSRTCSLRAGRRTRALSGGATVATLHLGPNTGA